MTNYVPGPYEVTTITPETRGFRTTTMQVRGGAYKSPYLRTPGGEMVTLYRLVANIQGIESVHSADGDIMYYQPTGEARATAHLFAAAPDLLDVLRAIVGNARLVPDPAMQGMTDIYAVPIDDIEAAAWEAVDVANVAMMIASQLTDWLDRK